MPWGEIGAGESAYQYNGKEMNDDLELEWLDYGARWYDPAIGRFTGVDPISDQFPHVSTYNYAENEPIGGIDLWGLQRVEMNSWHQYYEQNTKYRQEYINNLGPGATAVSAAFGVGTLLAVGGAWAATNPAKAAFGLRDGAIMAFEGLTEQQIASAGLAAKVGDELIDLAPGYNNFFQKILYGQWTGKAITPSINNGKLYIGEELANGVADFVITKEGNLVLGSGHHFMSGQSESVIAAGEVLVEDGVLKTVGNQSGHYQPSEDMLGKFVDYFNELGVDVSNVKTTTERISN